MIIKLFIIVFSHWERLFIWCLADIWLSTSELLSLIIVTCIETFKAHSIRSIGHRQSEESSVRKHKPVVRVSHSSKRRMEWSWVESRINSSWPDYCVLPLFDCLLWHFFSQDFVNAMVSAFLSVRQVIAWFKISSCVWSLLPKISPRTLSKPMDIRSDDDDPIFLVTFSRLEKFLL